MGNLYVKAAKKVIVEEKKIIQVKDIADLQGDETIVNHVKNLKVMDIPLTTKTSYYLISILDLVKIIKYVYPEIAVSSVGEMDTVLEYRPKKRKEYKVWTFIKVLFICCILFTGSGIAIMAFQTDGAIPEVFQNIYAILTGEKIKNPLILEIPYSIGLAVGIIVFFNHISSKRLTDDPTPIEVEMRLYERDVEDCLIETLTEEKKG